MTSLADTARHALDRGDLDAALPLLRRLVTYGRSPEPDVAVLVERAGHLARWAHDPSPVAALLDLALASFGSAGARGRVLHAYARLDAFRGLDADREQHLRAAQAAYRDAGDLAGLSIVQSDRAFPVGPVESLAERARLAGEALDFARVVRDPLAVVASAGTYARILCELADDRAYAAWAEGRATLPPVGPPPPWAADVAPRFFYNWARILVLRGDYAACARVVDEGKAFSTQHYWVRSFAVVDAVRHWRLGEWDRASSCADVALAGEYQPGSDLARIVRAHLSYERDRQPDVAPFAALTEELVADQNVAGPVALALLMRMRDAHREPRPHRGLAAAVGDAVRMGRRIAWEDVLPAAAAVTPSAARAEWERLGDTGPRGPRADATSLHLRGLLQRDVVLLGEAAEAYLALGEPYLAASCLGAAGRRREAARLCHDMGAERSLASVLRGTAGARGGLRIPSSQRFAGNPGLTPRESEVARLASRGYTATEIAAELAMAERTVYVHLQSVKRKLGVRRKAELVRHFDDR